MNYKLLTFTTYDTPKWLYVVVVLKNADTVGVAIGCRKQMTDLHCKIRPQDKVKPT